MQSPPGKAERASLLPPKLINGTEPAQNDTWRWCGGSRPSKLRDGSHISSARCTNPQANANIYMHSGLESTSWTRNDCILMAALHCKCGTETAVFFHLRNFSSSKCSITVHWQDPFMLILSSFRLHPIFASRVGALGSWPKQWTCLQVLVVLTGLQTAQTNIVWVNTMVYWPFM